MDPDLSDDTDNFDEFYNMGGTNSRHTKMEKFDQNVRKFHGDQLEYNNDHDYRTGPHLSSLSTDKAKLNRVRCHNFIQSISSKLTLY